MKKKTTHFFTTFRLTAMPRREIKCDDKPQELDNHKHFAFILYYLRNGCYYPPAAIPTNRGTLEEILIECQFYHIKHLENLQKYLYINKSITNI